MNDKMNKVSKQLTEDQIGNISLIKGLGNSFYESLCFIDDCRETELAKTKLEECVMWAVKGICNERE